MLLGQCWLLQSPVRFTGALFDLPTLKQGVDPQVQVAEHVCQGHFFSTLNLRSSDRTLNIKKYPNEYFGSKIAYAERHS